MLEITSKYVIFLFTAEVVLIVLFTGYLVIDKFVDFKSNQVQYLWHEWGIS